MFVYVLHFDEPVRGKRHYMGSTEEAQLDTRLRRHQAGTGASLTRQAHNQGVGFSLAGLFQVPDRSHEKQMKARRRHKHFCYQCRENTEVHTMFFDVLYFAPIAKAQECTVLSFPNRTTG